MTDEIRARLTEAGMNVDDALKRFMNNEAMLEKFLKKFTADTTYQALVDAISAGDVEEAFKAAHTLKGVAANFSFETLGQKVSDACEEFRAGNLERGSALMGEITTLYDRIVNVINEI